MGFTQPKGEGLRISVNPVPTEPSGATDLCHGSRLEESHEN